MLKAQGTVAVCMIMIRNKQGGMHMRKRWLTEKSISMKDEANKEDTKNKVEQHFLEGEEAQWSQVVVNSYVLCLHFIMLLNVLFVELGLHGGKRLGRERNSSYGKSLDVNSGNIHRDCRSYVGMLLHLGNLFSCKGSISVSLGFCILL